MAHIARSRTVAAAVPDVWRVLADFGAINTWLDRIDHCCLLAHGDDGPRVGTTRRVQMGRQVLVERITEFEPSRVLAYEIQGLPRAMGRVRNRWTLQPTGGGQTVVTITTTVETGHRLAERVACRALALGSDQMLAGLADRLENCRV